MAWKRRLRRWSGVARRFAMVATLAILLTGATLGGYAGGLLGNRLPARWLRALVLSVGSSMTLYYFATTFFSG